MAPNLKLWLVEIHAVDFFFFFKVLCTLWFSSYAIMKMCWNLEPTERPTFSKIAHMVQKLIGDQPEQEPVSLGPVRPSDHLILSEPQQIHSDSPSCLWWIHLLPWFHFEAHLLHAFICHRLQRIYQNLQRENAEVEVCEEPKCCDCPCDQSCDHEQEEQALMNTNNYQFCWKAKAKPSASIRQDSMVGTAVLPTTAGPTAVITLVLH